MNIGTDPWEVIGWLLVAMILLVALLVAGILCAAVVIGTRHWLASMRDTSRWEADRPSDTVWRGVSLDEGVMRVHLLGDGRVSAQLIGSRVSQVLTVAEVPAWLRRERYRLVLGCAWRPTVWSGNLRCPAEMGTAGQGSRQGGV